MLRNSGCTWGFFAEIGDGASIHFLLALSNVFSLKLNRYHTPNQWMHALGPGSCVFYLSLTTCFLLLSPPSMVSNSEDEEERTLVGVGKRSRGCSYYFF